MGLFDDFFGGGDDPAGPAVGIGTPSGNFVGGLFGQQFVNASARERRRGIGSGFRDDPSGTNFFGGTGPAIQRLAGQQTFSPFEQQLQEALLGGGGGFLPQNTIFGRAQQGLEDLAPFIQQGAETGFRTDATDFFNQARNQFFRDVPASIAEVAGSRGSGFQNILARESQDFFTDQARAQVGLDEAARARQQGFLQFSPQFQAARAALPINITSDIFGLGTQSRGIRDRPDERLIGQAAQFSGFQPQFLQSGFPTSNASTASTGALANTLPGIFESFFPNQQANTPNAGADPVNAGFQSNFSNIGALFG